MNKFCKDIPLSELPENLEDIASNLDYYLNEGILLSEAEKNKMLLHTAQINQYLNEFNTK